MNALIDTEIYQPRSRKNYQLPGPHGYPRDSKLLCLRPHPSWAACIWLLKVWRLGPFQAVMWQFCQELPLSEHPQDWSRLYQTCFEAQLLPLCKSPPLEFLLEVLMPINFCVPNLISTLNSISLLVSRGPTWQQVYI